MDTVFVAQIFLPENSRQCCCIFLKAEAIISSLLHVFNVTWTNRIPVDASDLLQKRDITRSAVKYGLIIAICKKLRQQSRQGVRCFFYLCVEVVAVERKGTAIGVYRLAQKMGQT